MNNWNPWEKQLRRWTPRRPSPKLKARLFGQGEWAPTPVLRRPALWGWLMPAFGALMLAALVLTQDNPQVRANSHSLLAAVGSNANWEADSDAHFFGDHNVLTKALAFTNDAQAPSAFGLLLSFNTNSLRR